MKINKVIEHRLKKALMPSVCVVSNVSHMHAMNNGQSHFDVRIASPLFAGKTRIQRHQMIYQAVDYHNLGIHALSIQAMSEGQPETSVHFIPPCSKVQ